MVPIVIQVLHLPLVERRAFHVVLCPELVIGERQAADVPHSRLDEAALVAGGEVLQVEDAEQVISKLDEHPFTKPRCLNRAHGSKVAQMFQAVRWSQPPRVEISGRSDSTTIMNGSEHACAAAAGTDRSRDSAPGTSAFGRETSSSLRAAA